MHRKDISPEECWEVQEDVRFIPPSNSRSLISCQYLLQQAFSVCSFYTTSHRYGVKVKQSKWKAAVLVTFVWVVPERIVLALTPVRCSSSNVSNGVGRTVVLKRLKHRSTSIKQSLFKESGQLFSKHPLKSFKVPVGSSRTLPSVSASFVWMIQSELRSECEARQ